MIGWGDFVDPFLGIAAVDLPDPEGIEATCYQLKAWFANNHPGAWLSLGPVPALPYSGVYLTRFRLPILPPAALNRGCSAVYLQFCLAFHARYSANIFSSGG